MQKRVLKAGGKKNEQIEKDREAVLSAEDPLRKAIELVQTDTYEEDDTEEDVEDTQEPDGDTEGEQQFIEVSQDTVKAALQALLTKENGLLSHLYEKHAEINEKLFEGKLSRPLITIEKLSNKTLADYQPGRNASGIENHIRFNRNFVALNPTHIVDNVLTHEMIHQWQDEVLYVKKGQEAKDGTKVPSIDKESLKAMENSFATGFPVTFTVEKQLRRPANKSWHNKYFKAMACHVNIPAQGDKCYQPPVVMPEAKSYNRKFVCGCIASNGKPITVWSTRAIFATCNECGMDFMELRKSGGIIEVKLSDVERPGEDAVQKKMEGHGFNNFKRFLTKEEQESFIEEISNEEDYLGMESGFYQKEHNSYKEGFRYWVAYATTEPEKKEYVEPEKLEVESEEVEPEERVYSVESAQDILDLYKELGTTRKVAERLGVAQSSLVTKAKKLGVNFKEGRIDETEK